MHLNPDLLAVVLLGYLRKRARGRAAARTQGRIGWDLRRLGLAVTTRDVRDALAALVLAGWPIGTGARGTWLCVTPGDWRAGYRNLYVRLREQAKRCRKFKETAQDGRDPVMQPMFGEPLPAAEEDRDFAQNLTPKKRGGAHD